MIVARTIAKHGGSLTIAVPPKWLSVLGLRKGSRVRVALRGRELIIRAADSEKEDLASFTTPELLDELRRRGL